MKKEVVGNTYGLKKSYIELLESLYDIESGNEVYACEELVENILSITHFTNREIAVFINKKGNTDLVSVGTFNNVSFINEIKRGSRCIHTHPSSDGRLSVIDLNTLKKENLLAMASIGVREGKINDIYGAYINTSGNIVNCGPYFTIDQTAKLMEEIYSFATLGRHEEESYEEKIIAVGVNTLKSKTNMDELEELISTAGGVCVEKIVQNKQSFDSAFYVGKGKIEDIGYLVQIHNIDTVVFDDALTVSQMRNISQLLPCKVLDRSLLILDIFASRANSSEGKIQVELAQLNHMLPLLSGQGISLSRLGGGIGTRGPGESKLETDKRHILRRLDYLKKQLKVIEKRRSDLRLSRKSKDFFVIAIAGYTNSGKSTLLNKLTDSEVMAKDMLFATLDPSSRGTILDNKTKVLFVDTVGFISKLPHELIEAFKSTLEEVAQSDLVLHVLDGSNSEVNNQKDVVYDILKDINADEVPVIEVVNKGDIKSEKILEAKKDRVFISAITGQGMDILNDLIQKIASQNKKIYEKKVPYHNGKVSSFIHDNTSLIKEKYEKEYILYTFSCSDSIYKKIENILHK